MANGPPPDEGGDEVLSKYYLYQTKTRYYLVAHTRNEEVWRVLKLSRLEACELDVAEDPTRYTKAECARLLKAIHDGNLPHGGLQLVCKAYGVIGCFRFLEGYYLLLISKRRYVGSICGHKVYGIAEKGLVQLTHPAVQARESSAERRYRRLLLTVLDLTKDFFFSYTYHLARSLQANFCDPRPPARDADFESMFVWNEFLTWPLREKLGNCRWVVGLVHGFWAQRTLSLWGRQLTLTLLARRSKYFAGTRYRKRGVNDRGHVANDVETEQMVMLDGGAGGQAGGGGGMSSVVQVRGSIPLYWSQEGTKLKPDITVQQYDPLYKATQLHFDHLRARYGDPIVVLNLVKQLEKRPRETLLANELTAAVAYINARNPYAAKVQHNTYDMHHAAKRRGSNVLGDLAPTMELAVQAVGQFCYMGGHAAEGTALSLQHGVLRTNCIDCLDRTNVGQYGYGLAALGAQLAALGVSDTAALDGSSSVARQLMHMYEAMGNTLAMQYGGSEAHSSFFQRQRGDWEAATQSRDLVTSIRRFYSNTYTDAEKQDAINLFLGNFSPRAGAPQLWELDSDYYLHSGRGTASALAHEPSRATGFYDFESQRSVAAADLAAYLPPAQADSAPPPPAPGLERASAPPPLARAETTGGMDGGGGGRFPFVASPEEPALGRAEALPSAAVGLASNLLQRAFSGWSPDDAGDGDSSDGSGNGDSALTRSPRALPPLWAEAAAAAAAKVLDAAAASGAAELEPAPPSEFDGASTRCDSPAAGTDAGTDAATSSASVPAVAAGGGVMWNSGVHEQAAALMSGGGAGRKKAKLESFDKVLAKQPYAAHPAGLYDAPAQPKAYLPTWLSSPLGIARRSIDAGPRADAPEPVPTPALVPRTPLRTRSEGEEEGGGRRSPLIKAGGGAAGQRPARRGEVVLLDGHSKAADGGAGISAATRTPPVGSRSMPSLRVSGAGAAAERPQSGGRWRQRSAMFPFASFVQHSSTIEAMHIEAPGKRGGGGDAAGGKTGRRLGWRWRRGKGGGGVDAALDGEFAAACEVEDLGVAPQVLAWWREQGGGEERGWWWEQEGRVREVYRRYLDTALAIDGSDVGDIGAAERSGSGSLEATYSKLCSPALVLSMDGFQGGSAGEWRRSTGIVSAITVSERELRSIAEAELGPPTALCA